MAEEDSWGGGLTQRQLEATSGLGGNGNGSGGAVTVADGADVAQGATTQAAAAADGTGNYSSLQAAKRGLLNWAALLARIPALVSGRMPVQTFAGATDANGNGTREYNRSVATRTVVGATSSAAIPLPALGASREVQWMASTRCLVKLGTSAMAPAAATDTDVQPVAADTYWHERIPIGVTHYTVIRDTTDGIIRCIPVA